MNEELEQYGLWRRTLAPANDNLEPQRSILRQAFLSMRKRVAQLVQVAGANLPDLTVHDITHLDALWGVAEEIAGEQYPLNPAEAFVLGAGFMLHDAAHVFAAFENGLEGIKATTEWKDLIAQRFKSKVPAVGSAEDRLALLLVVRCLHA